MFKDELMAEKIVDLMAYRIEKALKESGFTLKQDDDKKLKLLIKLKSNDISE